VDADDAAARYTEVRATSIGGPVGRRAALRLETFGTGHLRLPFANRAGCKHTGIAGGDSSDIHEHARVARRPHRPNGASL
jgi:hypothetical protein